jgi:hypothetical protein
MARQTRGDRLLPANTKAIQRAVKAASKASSKVTEYRVDGARGLVLHVLPSGTATWFFHYDAEVGKRRERRKWKIGRVDEVSLAEALGEAERLRPLIRQGADPLSQKAAYREAMTFAEMAVERFGNGDPLRPGTERDYRHVLGKDVLPVIGNIPAKAVTREDVIKVLDGISARGSTRRADTARAVISSIFSYGLDRGLVSTNPASGLRNRHDYQPRDVIATPEDIRQLWAAMATDEAAMSPAVATIVKLALLTGLRRTEVAATKKMELDLESVSPALTIPRGRAKNRTAHRAVGQESVVKAREVCAKWSIAVEKGAKVLEDVITVAQSNAKTVARRIADDTLANTSSALDAAQQLVDAKTLPEAAQLQVKFVQTQMNVIGEQGKALIELSLKAAKETADAWMKAASNAVGDLKTVAA